MEYSDGYKTPKANIGNIGVSTMAKSRHYDEIGTDTSQKFLIYLK
jgi:hypothetical protein